MKLNKIELYLNHDFGIHEISINIEDNSINLHVSKEDIDQRSKEWNMPEPNYKSGALAKYAFLVGSAADGAITDPSNFLKMSEYLQKNKLVTKD